MSLKKENETLKDRLANVNRAFDQLLETTLKAASSLPSQELDAVQSLCETVERYRLPPVVATDANGNDASRRDGELSTPFFMLKVCFNGE